ncbi:MAG: hypothetical protein R3C26_26345 [Calditrichia bacterium]
MCTITGRATGVALFIDQLKHENVLGTVTGENSIIVIPDSGIKYPEDKSGSGENCLSEMELKSRIDAAFLPVVNKPTRFLGNEFDAFVKNSDEIKLKIALCYADLYDAGM